MSRKILAASVAAITVAGFCGLAVAKDALHTMTVKSPEGGTVIVHYTGNVAPKIAFDAAPGPAAFSQFQSPFAMMDRIAAQMDQRMDAMMREANTMMANVPDSNAAVPSAFWNMPMYPGGLTSIANGGKGTFCMKSMQITSTGNGKAPRVVTHTAGNCGGGASTSAAPAHAVQGSGPKTPI